MNNYKKLENLIGKVIIEYQIGDKGQYILFKTTCSQEPIVVYKAEGD